LEQKLALLKAKQAAVAAGYDPALVTLSSAPPSYSSSSFSVSSSSSSSPSSSSRKRKRIQKQSSASSFSSSSSPTPDKKSDKRHNKTNHTNTNTSQPEASDNNEDRSEVYRLSKFHDHQPDVPTADNESDSDHPDSDEDVANSGTPSAALAPSAVAGEISKPKRDKNKEWLSGWGLNEQGTRTATTGQMTVTPGTLGSGWSTGRIALRSARMFTAPLPPPITASSVPSAPSIPTPTTSAASTLQQTLTTNPTVLASLATNANINNMQQLLATLNAQHLQQQQLQLQQQQQQQLQLQQTALLGLNPGGVVGPNLGLSHGLLALNALNALNSVGFNHRVG